MPTALQQTCAPEPNIERGQVRRPLGLSTLTLSFLKIGAIGFGGGMAIIALMENEFVRQRQELGAEEFLHGVGLSQILGPFAVNTACFVGYRLRGVVGALSSAIAFVAPSFVMVLAFSWLYFRFHTLPMLQGALNGIGPVVIALILSAAWSMGKKAVRSLRAAILCVAALAAGLCKINPLYVLVCAGILGVTLAKLRLVPGEDLRESVETAGSGSTSQKSRFSAFLLTSTPALGAAAAVPLVQLGLTFLTIGFLFFGGGFAVIPLLHQTLVIKLGWLSAQEFIDGVAISNLTPGPVSILAAFAGYRVHGVLGAIVATLALYLPALLVMTALSRGYERASRHADARAFLSGVAPAVVGLVLSSMILLAGGALHSWRGGLVAVVAAALLVRWRISPAILLAVGAVAGATAIVQ